MSSTTPTPAATLAEATDEDALPSGRLALLGTFLKADTASALVRTASGHIRRIAPGDRLGSAWVLAIEEGRVAVAQNGTTRMLRMPAD